MNTSSRKCILNFNTSQWSSHQHLFDDKSCSVHSEAFDTPCDSKPCSEREEDCEENKYQTEAVCSCRYGQRNGDCICSNQNGSKLCGGIVEASKSGIYEIPTENGNVTVWCDMETQYGGWIVFQRRQDGSENFDRNWNEYKQGFGTLNSEHWLGNENLHALTKLDNMDLLVELKEYNRSCKLYALYSNFSIGSEGEFYRLGGALTFIKGTAGDGGIGLSFHKGYNFSTWDNDNDEAFYKNGNERNCGNEHESGWWFGGPPGSCKTVDLNGLYSSSVCQEIYAYGIKWNPAHAWYYNFHGSEMKFRPSHIRQRCFDQNWCEDISCDIKCKSDTYCGCGHTAHCVVP